MHAQPKNIQYLLVIYWNASLAHVSLFPVNGEAIPCVPICKLLS